MMHHVQKEEVDVICRSPSLWLQACLGLALLTIAGCSLEPDRDPQLTAAVKKYYATHATEEGGNCRKPKIDMIYEHRIVDASSDGADVMVIRYSYFDRHADMDANHDWVVHLSQKCAGITERQFVVARQDIGYHVKDMTGELRDGESTN